MQQKNVQCCLVVQCSAFLSVLRAASLHGGRADSYLLQVTQGLGTREKSSKDSICGCNNSTNHWPLTFWLAKHSKLLSIAIGLTCTEHPRHQSKVCVPNKLPKVVSVSQGHNSVPCKRCGLRYETTTIRWSFIWLLLYKMTMTFRSMSIEGKTTRYNTVTQEAWQQGRLRCSYSSRKLPAVFAGLSVFLVCLYFSPLKLFSGWGNINPREAKLGMHMRVVSNYLDKAKKTCVAQCLHTFVISS